ncbi:hypothetical protein AB6735_21155 [Mucilaginibacter sp. RCC_168]|jgi:hypothetical protein|uniref:hypothetical protein n=1 Tax=Mucilaginibacter sp. RCC_168 TaxID=3239221 RepID=UPI0035261F0E
MENLQKQVKALKIYAGVLTLLVLALMIMVFRQNNSDNEHFKHITAERMDIVDSSGKIRMAISNRERQHPGTIGGKELPKRDRPAGMIFFNDDGDECGGLVYDGDKKSASMTYSIDQYQNDQIMQIQYSQDKDAGSLQRSYGLKLWDKYDNFPTVKVVAYADSLKKLNDTAAYNAGIKKLQQPGVITAERLFVGKNTKGEVGLFLRDDKGKPRLKIYINAQNQPVIETLDDKGAVVSSK